MRRRRGVLLVAAVAACGGAIVDETLGTRQDIDYAVDAGRTPPRAPPPAQARAVEPEPLPAVDAHVETREEVDAGDAGRDAGRESFDASECSGRCVPMRCEDYPSNQCGVLDDGCGGSITCDRPCATFDGGQQPCIPSTCIQHQMQCGTYSDGCGAVVQCSSCPAGARCTTTGSWSRECVPCD